MTFSYSIHQLPLKQRKTGHFYEASILNNYPLKKNYIADEIDRIYNNPVSKMKEICSVSDLLNHGNNSQYIQ